MNVAAVIPYRDTDGSRALACARVKTHLRQALPDAAVITIDDGREPFSRGCSIMRGIEHDADRADIFVVCDADLLVPGDQLRAAVELAATADGLVIGFSRYLYLTREQSFELEQSPYRDLPASPAHEWAMTTSVGGAGAFSARTIELTGGYPAVFRGWGMEDVAFERLTERLAGPTRRVDGDAYHLWHPVDPTNNLAAPSYQRNLQALNRILAAGSPDELGAVVEHLDAQDVRA